MKTFPRIIKAASLAVAAFALSGCVVLPYGWGHGHRGHRHVEQRVPHAYPAVPHDHGGYRGR